MRYGDPSPQNFRMNAVNVGRYDIGNHNEWGNPIDRRISRA